MPTSSKPSSLPTPSLPRPKKLLDRYSEALRNLHYSLRTEETYIAWVRQFILYHNKRHPAEMGVAEINDFVTHLVNQKSVAASTQNQAISAILFLYRNVLQVQLDEAALLPIRPGRPKRVPTVLSRDEAKRVIAKIDGVYKLTPALACRCKCGPAYVRQRPASHGSHAPARQRSRFRQPPGHCA